MSVYSFETGLTLTFTLLDQLKQSAPHVLENALQNIYGAMLKLKAGLIKPNDYKFFAREQILNRHRDYLVTLIQDETASQSVRDLAVKLVLIIGNLRCSGEDYLMAYNLIKTYNLTVNLDAELSLNKFFQSENSQEGLKESFKVNTKESKDVELMSGIGNDPTRYNFTQLSFDDRHMYLYNSYSGLYKYGIKATQTTKAGLKYAQNTYYTSNQRCPLWIKGKLYVRDHDQSDKPFVPYDPRTLDTKDNKEFMDLIATVSRKEGDNHNDRFLERTSYNAYNTALNSTEFDNARIIQKTPLFTDGDLIYVISTYPPVNSKSKELEYQWEIEAYDPDTLKCVFFKRLDLKPEEDKESTHQQTTKINDDTEYLKSNMNEYNILNHVYATNGKILSIAIDTSMFFFDLETGKRTQDRLKLPCKINGYNVHTNTFWHYKQGTDKLVFSNFKVDGFKTKSELENADTLNFNELLNNRAKVVIEEQKDPQKPQARSMEGLLKKLGNSKSDNIDIHSLRHNADSSQSLYLIMHILGRGCDEMDQIITKLDALYPDLVHEKLICQSELFRSTFAVSLTSRFIIELNSALEHFSDFIGGAMTDDNILSQYQFLWTTKLALKLIQTLDRLKLQLSQVVDDNEISSRFVELVSKLCSKILEPGIDSSQFQATENKDEVEALWKECVSQWRAVQNVLISIASENNDDITSKINELGQALSDDNVLPSQRMFLQYISSVDSMKKIIDPDNEESFNSLFRIFEILCDKKAKKLSNRISELHLNSHSNELEYSDLEIIQDEFIYSFANRVLIMVYSIIPSLSKAIDNDQKKKIETLTEKSEQNKKYYIKTFNKLSDCTQMILNSANVATKAVYTEAEEAYNFDEASKDDQEIQKKNAAIKSEIGQYHESLYTIAHDHNKFLQFVHIYVACYSSDKTHKMTKNLNNM